MTSGICRVLFIGGNVHVLCRKKLMLHEHTLVSAKVKRHNLQCAKQRCRVKLSDRDHAPVADVFLSSITYQAMGVGGGLMSMFVAMKHYRPNEFSCVCRCLADVERYFAASSSRLLRSCSGICIGHFLI